MKMMRLAALAALSLATLSPVMAAAAQPAVIYDDAYEGGWQDWSWAVTHPVADAAHIHSGAAALGVKADPWGALTFSRNDPFDSTGYTTLSFWINGGPAHDQSLIVLVNGGTEGRPAFTIPPLTDGWTHIEIPLKDLAADNTGIKAIWIQNHSGAPAGAYYVDDVELH